MTATGVIEKPAITAGDGAETSAARLRIAVARLSRRLRPTAAAGSLTPTEVDVLVAIDRRGPLRLSDLAGFAGLNPTMLSRLIPKLEAAGLMRRLASAADRRVCRVEINAKGRRLLERIRSERNDALSRLLRELNAADRSALARAVPVLEALADRMVDQPPTTARVGSR
ncbi:MAG TPA: MarR family transcriptional regulator [Candidatus Saccharimonadales bacterium]|nr:MarR family transcriptional regulator [Candidatus Saccharimonadales bacterium]